MDFDCQRCGWCCENININVSYSDIIRWAKEKRFDILSEIEYIDHEDRKKRGFYIRKTVTSPKQACPYLTIEDGLSSCSIYETRPRSCVEFPEAHGKDEKEKIKCPARGDFEVDEKTLYDFKREQAFDFMLAEDRKEKLKDILSIAKNVHVGLHILKEFGDDPQETLKVTTKGTERTAWTEVGSLHLQEQDEPTHYIWTATKKAEHGDFDFANTAQGGTTLNSVTLYVYAKNASGSQNISCFVWNGTSFTEYIITPGTTYGWSNVSVPVLDTWTKVDGAQLYVKQPNNTARTDIDAAYLLCDYTAGEIAKGFSDSGSGADVFAKVITFQSPEFSDVGAGADTFDADWRALFVTDSIGGVDVFETLYREMGFADTISGDDVWTIPWKLIPKAFADSIGGTDVWTLTRPVYFTDVGSGTDVFTKAVTLQSKAFIDTISGSDVFATFYREMGFVDTIGGVDVFTVMLFKGFADSAGGVDVWTLTRPVYFSDSVTGTDVFTTPYRELPFADTISGADVFTTPYREMGFVDTVAGTDVMTIMKLLSVVDTILGSDVFTTPYRELKVSDTISGADVFTMPLAQMGFADTILGTEVFEKFDVGGIVSKFMVDTGQGFDVFAQVSILDFTDAIVGTDVFLVTKPEVIVKITAEDFDQILITDGELSQVKITWGDI